MKRLLTLMLALLSMLWAHADRGGYKLRHVNIEIVAHENSVWDVTETLQVEFDQPRHGIYRYIPTRFSYWFLQADSSEVEHKYKIIVKDVEVDGYEFETEENDTDEENTIIKIGNKDVEEGGVKTYVVRYKLQYPDDRLPDEDFICHTIWGTGWGTTVDELRYSVRFEKTLPRDYIAQGQIYSGEHGSEGNDDDATCSLDTLTNSLVGAVYNLPAYHGVTLSAPLPQGYWKAEGKNRTLFYVFVGLTVVFALLTVKGMLTSGYRKPVETLTFYPPEGISSAEVGMVMDGHLSYSEMASLIPWLAHRGYLSIEEVADKQGRVGKHADLALTMLKPLPITAPDYQRLFVKALFGEERTARLSQLSQLKSRQQVLKKAMTALEDLFKGSRKLSSQNNALQWWCLMVIAAVGVFLTGHATDQFNIELAKEGALTIGLGALCVGMFRAKLTPRNYLSNRLKRIVKLLGIIVLAVAALASVPMVCTADRVCVSPVYFVLGSAVLLLISFFTNRLYVDSEYRLKMAGELLGLRQFIKTAEQDRLKMLVDENPDYFYDILPYAMVFGLTDKWSEQFEQISVGEPKWFVAHKSHTANHFTGAAMASLMSSSISRAVAKTSRSMSRGRSRRGRSRVGGGGGGGGGGSW